MEWESTSGGVGGGGRREYGGGQPYLEILVQPQGKFRFRYKSEMTGKHGSLLGASTAGNINTNTSTTTTGSFMMTGSGFGGGGGGQQFVNVESVGTGGSSGYYNMTNSPIASSSLWPSSSTASSSGNNINMSTSSSVATKIFPTVKLHNFGGEGIIRCSVVCEGSPYFPHPHLLEMGQSAVGSCPEMMTASESSSSLISPENCFIEIPVSAYNDYTAVFQGLNIIYVSKKDMRRQLQYKMSQLLDYGPDTRRKVSLDKLDDLSLNINLNVVALYFEAFIRTNLPNSIQFLCNPVVSTPIQHNKSTQTSELRIVRIDKCSSFCTGDEEVFILVEKVDKHNIQVKFYQESDKGAEIWKAYGKFSKLDVHHQYAIVFKTPPYRSCDIDTEVDVWIQLERPTDGATSTPIPFKYKPVERIRKMPKRQRSRGGGGGSGDNQDSGASSRPFEPQGRAESPGANSDNSGNPSGNESDQDNGNNPLAGPSPNIRQGVNSSSSQISFPCDTSSIMASSDEVSQSKALAMNVALSICQGLYGWAETSDFSLVLQKLRHLLCLVNENGDNALHSSIIHQQPEPFLRILETLTSSPDTVSVINEPNLQNLTPITLAVLSDRLDFVQELVRYNADVSITNSEGDTPIHLAVKGNNIPCVKALLQSSTASSAINKFNYSSMSPLHIAVANGFNELVELLCIHKVSLTSQEGTYGRTPLHTAVEKETKESIISTMLILKNGGVDADLANIQNYRGDTPLHCAANSGSTTLCALLLYHGADPMIENHVRKETEDEEEESAAESDERLSGQTVFDVAASEQVLRVLKGTLDDWEIVLKACSPLLPTPTPSVSRSSSIGMEFAKPLSVAQLLVDNNKDKESDSSRALDSGIDINNFNSSQFLNSSSSNQL